MNKRWRGAPRYHDGYFFQKIQKSSHFLNFFRLLNVNLQEPLNNSLENHVAKYFLILFGMYFKYSTLGAESLHWESNLLHQRSNFF